MSVNEHEAERNSAVDRALLLLEMVANNKGGTTLTEMAKELNMPKSTAHRLLETLKARGFVEYQENSERYIIGLKSVEVGVSGLRNLGIVDVAVYYLCDLAESTGETSFLAVYNEGEMVYLYKVEGTQSIRTTAQLGSRKPVHATSLGKAVLSQLSLEEVDRILEEKGMERFTEHTITDRQEYHEELSKVRVQGYAEDREENEVGLTCFSVPVFNYTGQVVGAISIAGPTLRMVENRDGFTRNLMETALHISRRLGYVPSMRHSSINQD
ncbi:MAG: IclR family transcriptional regulator [Firmicutes bacterium]|nr:IclR family transcriptional regulator [Bacillota bacterium]